MARFFEAFWTCGMLSWQDLESIEYGSGNDAYAEYHGGNILHIIEENGGDNWFTWRAAVVVGWKQVAGTCSGSDGEVGVLGDEYR
uniref:Uncharacterized protein n=1 Tax=Oryza nivara TaxID=4536 RepID=A0A0E0HR43_ORYNI